MSFDHNLGLSPNALQVVTKRYLQPGETPFRMFERVADTLAEVEYSNGNGTPARVQKLRDDFLAIMASKKFTPAGRTLTNAGTRHRLISNCIVLHFEDTLESIMQTLKDATLLQKVGSV